MTQFEQEMLAQMERLNTNLENITTCQDAIFTKLDEFQKYGIDIND